MLDGLLVGAVVGAVVGALVGVAILVVGLLMRPKKCPDCGELLPKVRKPANTRQMLWGGSTCPKCGCEVDRRGRKLER